MTKPGKFFIVPRSYLSVIWLAGPTGVIRAHTALQQGDKQGVCWPSVSRIGHDTGLSVSTVRERLADLQHIGIVTVTRSKTDTNLTYAEPLPVESRFPPTDRQTAVLRNGGELATATTVLRQTVVEYSARPEAELYQ